MQWRDVTNAFKHTICQLWFRNSPDHAVCYVRVMVKYTACDYWPMTRKQALNKPGFCSKNLLLPRPDCSHSLCSPFGHFHFCFIWIFLPIIQLSTPVPAEFQHVGGCSCPAICCFPLPSCSSLLFTFQRSSAASRSKPRSSALGKQKWKITSKSPCF